MFEPETTKPPEKVAAARAHEEAELVQKAKDAGWHDRVPFKYDQLGDTVTGTQAANEGEGGCSWLGDAVVYEFTDDFGDTGARNEELEKTLFEDPNIPRAGMLIQSLTFNIDTKGPDMVHPIRHFEDAGLHPLMLENVKLCKYKAPTPIQAYCLPAVLTGHDVVAIAQTGSGKTAAFLIPILSRLMGKARQLAAPRPNVLAPGYNALTDRVRAEPLVLIVCPTRELACQIFDEARRLCYRTMLRPCVIYGGAPTRAQREQLEKGCDVLVATPGRLMDFMGDLKLLSLSRLKYTVIDEADEMLSSGWEDAMEKIFQGSDNNADADHTYLMFSATFPKSARRLARDFMEQDFVKIKIGRVGSTHQSITQQIVFVEESMKNTALYDLIMSGGPQRSLIFVNTKDKCDRVDDFLYNKGLPSTSIHADRTQREREDALRAFRTATAPIMVATGVTARGLDVANIKHVINYDLPSVMHGGVTEYVHRIGRTARIGNEGKATSFYNERNEDLAEDLVKILLESKQDIPDFLEDKKPADPNNIEWHDGTDDETEDDFSGGFDAGAAAGFAGGFDAAAGPAPSAGFDADAGTGWGGPVEESATANKVDTW